MTGSKFVRADLHFHSRSDEPAAAAMAGATLIRMTKFSILTIIEIFDLGKLARLAYQIATARALKGSIISKVFDVMGMLFWTLDELANNAAKAPPPSSPSPTPGPAPGPAPVPVPVC